MASEDVLERAEQWLDDREKGLAFGGAALVEALAAGVRELRKDKARLDWILERSVGHPVIAGQKTPAFDRDAIDAAMREERNDG